MTKKTLLTLGTLALLALTVGATAAFAQASDTTAASAVPSTRAGLRGANHGLGGPSWPGGGIDMEALLADELGISVEELVAARQRAYTTAVEQALDEGLITEAEAEWMLARQALQSYLDKEAMLAGALGISVEELQDARAEGTRLPALIDSLGLDADEVQDSLQAAYETAIAEAVADGIISQEMADQILSQTARGGFGRPGGFGRHGRGGFGPFPGGEQTTPNSDV